MADDSAEGGGGGSSADAVEDLYLKYFSDQITAIYRVHNPSKLDSIPALLTKHSARLPQLLEAIEKKYGVQHTMNVGDMGEAAEEDGGAEESKGAATGEDEDEAGGGALACARAAAAAKVGVGADEDEDEEDEATAVAGAAEDAEEAVPLPSIAELTEVQQDDDGLLIPQDIELCPVTGMPAQFCKYGPYSEAERTAGGCIGLAADGGAGGDAMADDSSLSKRKKKEKEKKKKQKSEAKGGDVIMEKVTRSRRKCWTVISGLENYDVKLKAVSKAISKKFATSSSVKKNPGGGEHIDVQGDITATLPPLLTGEFGIPSDKIFFQDGKTKISW